MMDRRPPWRSVVLSLAWVMPLAAWAQPESVPPLDAARLEAIFGWRGQWIESERTFRIVIPRTQTQVSVDGRTLEPALGLETWVAFRLAAEDGSRAVVLAELALLQDEVNPALESALAGDLVPVSLQSRLFFDEPRVMFLRLAGEGHPEALARAVAEAIDRVRQLRLVLIQPMTRFAGIPIPQGNSIDPALLKHTLGEDIITDGGVHRVIVPRPLRLPSGVELGPAAGASTWAAFVGTSEQAMIFGDVLARYDELVPVLKALRGGAIDVLAIQERILGATLPSATEPPPAADSARPSPAIFVRFLGKGPAIDLARAFRTVLDIQARTDADSSGLRGEEKAAGPAHARPTHGQ